MTVTKYKHFGAERIAKKYNGAVARDYEEKRSGTPKWKAEHLAVDHFLNDLQPRATVLDVPVGTGRFASIYAQHDLRCVGMDVSPDMLAQADTHMRDRYVPYTRVCADAVTLDKLPEADAVVCVRFLNWLSAEERAAFITKMCRAARVMVVMLHPDTTEAALHTTVRTAGWRIAQQITCVDENRCMVQLLPIG